MSSGTQCYVVVCYASLGPCFDTRIRQYTARYSSSDDALKPLGANAHARPDVLARFARRGPAEAHAFALATAAFAGGLPAGANDDFVPIEDVEIERMREDGA